MMVHQEICDVFLVKLKADGLKSLQLDALFKLRPNPPV